MTKTKGKTKNTKSEKTKRESGEMSPAKKLFRQYYPFYKYVPKNIKRLDKREVLAFGKIDTKFFLLVVILLVIGLIALFSASYINAINKYEDEYYYIGRQLKYVLLGLTLMFIASRVNYRVYKDMSFFFMTVAFGFLVLVLFFHGPGDFKRWLVIGGHNVFQPSELAKIALIMYCAWSMDRRKKAICSDWKMMFLYMTVVGVMCGLIALEKHVSATILVGLLGIAMTYLGGIDRKWYPLVIACIVGGAVLMVVFRDKMPAYAAERIIAWLDKSYDPGDARWQTNNSLYAIGSGGLFGVGLGNSRQKHMYVSEPQNDFIFAIFCEEMGLVGALVVIVLFVLLVKRAFDIAMRTKDTFASLLVMGIAVQVGLQAALNIAVVTDLIPNTGISLPFFSYGGTSLCFLLIEVGMVLSVSRSAKIEKI
ncbi:MAG: putative peptidoglycan glycosyltransferase FtsW [Acutalibacteraceae bacterium]|nr:putative peptidoglycan glycosyltransferase FtsW [Acutalibacteraceae bacterium]